MNTLVVSGLYQGYGTQTVLTGLDLTVPAGSLTAILGPSGSGKTTLLRVLAGLDAPERGTVSVGDLILDAPGVHVPAERRRIGYVPQEGSLFPHLTVAANVGFGLSRSARREGVEQLLELVGLSSFSERYPHQLSGGQQQRVALARALAIKPQIVLLDEPFASLDAYLRSELRRDIARILKEAAATTVLVTHDQDEALALADHIALLGEGRVLAFGDPRALYGQPPELAAATALGETNMLEAYCEGEHARCALGTVAIHASEPFHPQGPSLLLLRPEQLVLHLNPSDGAVAALVVELHYHGHDALARLTLAEDGPQTLLSRVPGDLALEPGQHVWVSVTGRARAWSTQHCSEAE